MKNPQPFWRSPDVQRARLEGVRAGGEGAYAKADFQRAYAKADFQRAYAKVETVGESTWILADATPGRIEDDSAFVSRAT